MSYYVDAVSNRCEVKGNIINSALFAMDDFQDILLEILNENGIEKPEADKWYPQALFINILLELMRSTGKNTLLKIGRIIIMNLLNQRNINSLEDALSQLPIIYALIHRGYGEGGINLVRTSSCSAILICDTPYPEELLFGMLQFIGLTYRPKGRYVYINVKKEYLYRERRDMNTRRFIISW